MTRNIIAAIALSTVATFANAYDAEATAPLTGNTQVQAQQLIDGIVNAFHNAKVPEAASF